MFEKLRRLDDFEVLGMVPTASTIWLADKATVEFSTVVFYWP